MSKLKTVAYLPGIAIALSLATSSAWAGPRSLRIGGDGKAVEIDSRTGLVKSTSSGARKGNEAAVATSLPAIDLTDMRLWNWNGRWHASEWDNSFSDVPWRYARVSQTGGDTIFSLDRSGAPELKAQNQTASKKGLWEVDVTLPTFASGLCVAPLWLYNGSTKDEIDFEFVGTRGLQVNTHSYNTGKHVTNSVSIANTEGLSGRRVVLGIRSDIDAGRIDMLIDGRVVHTYTRAGKPGAFPNSGLKPVMSMWSAKSGLGWAESWLGKWGGGAARMTVHGYRFTPG